MFLFQKKEEKTNYWKIVGITLGIIAGIGAVGVALYALLKKAGYFCCCDDCCDCDCCDCDEEYYDVTCPSCGEDFEVDEDTLLDGGVECPACGEHLEFDFDEDEEIEDAE